MEKYLPRLIEKQIKLALSSVGTVVVVGPKFIGKTTTCSRFAKSKYKLGTNDPSEILNTTSATKFPKQFLLQGERPMLVDEWQFAPEIWAQAKDLSDELGENLFIFTGSNSLSNEARNKIDHSGSGRIVTINMRPFSLYENGDSNGSVSIKDLFNNKVNYKDGFWGNLKPIDYAREVVNGGWPTNKNKSDEQIKIIVKGYCENIYLKDIVKIDGVKRSSNRTLMILKSLARNDSTILNKNTIYKDTLLEGDEASKVTFDDYYNALEKMYLFDNVKAWSNKLRSKKETMVRDKFEFVDPSIPAYFLGANKNNLFKDLNTFGFLFENLAIRDLKVYLEVNLGEVNYYRVYNGQDEVDAVLNLNGAFAFVEIKLAPDLKEIDLAAKKLIKISNDFIEKPAFLAIITGLENGYRRDDGVYVIPLSTLKD